MTGVIWQKVWRELWANKGRTIVVVMAIAIGVVAFGSAFITKDELISQMNAQFRAVNPTSLTIVIPDGYEPELLRWAQNYPGVSMVRASSANTVRLFTAEGSRNLTLLSLDDFKTITVNTIKTETGTFPPAKKELALERTSSSLLPYRLGDSVEVENANGRRKKLTLTGTVHDMQAIPANLSTELTGYVTFDTLRYLEIPDALTRMEIRTDASIKTKDEVTALGDRMKRDLENRGFTNVNTRSEKPDRHWGEDPSNAFMSILTIIGSFSLILSVFLVFNTVSAIIAGQKKQIGIMKAVGGRRNQIVFLFLVMTLLYGLLALLIAIPLGALLAYANLFMVGKFLNVDIIAFHIPPSVLALEAFASLVIPLLAALIPVWMGTRITVREAISDFPDHKKTNSLADRVLKYISFFSRPVIISLRNTFRKRGRLALTLVTLTIAGTLFISVIGNRESMMIEMENILNLYRYDIELYFSHPYDKNKAVTDIRKVPGVAAVETPLYLEGQWKRTAKKTDVAVTLAGITPGSDFTLPEITAGRMVAAGDTSKIVLSSWFVRDDPSIAVGQTIPLTIHDQVYKFEIIGVYMQPNAPMAYVNESYLERVSPDISQISSVQIRTEEHTQPYLNAFAKDVEQQMKKRGYDVAYSLGINSIRAGMQGQFDFLILFLLIMAVMVAVVGGLGLAGTMSLNVLERTREIGVMRSIGASNRSVFQLVVVESLSVGLLSWFLSIPLAVPMGYGFCFAIGKAFFEKVLPFSFSVMGIVLWLVIVIVISVLASILPARNAVRLTVRDTLSYE